MSTQQQGVYVFGAIRETQPKNFGMVRLNGQENVVYTVHYQNVAMVVALVKDEVLPDRFNLFAHQQIISEVMKQYCVIPMSFGNVFHSEQDVLLITEHLYDEFETLFSKLENKIEVGLKVFPKKEWINQEMKQNSVLSEWKSNKKDISDPSLFYDQIRLGELAQNFVLRLEKEVEEQIYIPLLGLSESGKQNSTIPGKTLLNAAYLLDREKEAAFDLKVNELFDEWKDKVEFKYTGPWPVYNFVNIRLRIEGV
ncbi:MAG: gvpF [Bacillus sp. (in: firmicutes)]|jgi:hypothetical protein|nr:gvpF [Bacillus sp. (in: firmicutes)]